MIVYGVSNHGPEQLFNYLNKTYNICIKDFTQIPFGGILDISKRVAQNLIFYSTHDFRKHLHYLQGRKFKSKKIFVMGSCQQLFSIDGITPLDYMQVDTRRFIDFEMFKDFLPLESINAPVTRSEDDYIDALSKKVQNGSILTSLMTTIYTISKTVNQKAVTFAICEWFYKGRGQKHLDILLSSAKTISGVNPKTCAKLEEILTSSTAANFQKAFAEMLRLRKADKPVIEKDIGKSFDVPAFELRYISVKYKNDALYKSKEKRSVDVLVDGGEK